MQGCVCPHPPLLVPAIGRLDREQIRATVAGMEQLATAIGEHETTVVISPHAPLTYDAFRVTTADRLLGHLGAFGAPQVRVGAPCDVEFAEALLEAALRSGLPMQGAPREQLDHGVVVPLTFLPPQRLVCLSIVADYSPHRQLGALVRRVAEELDRDVLFVASGDLSHRLIPGAPAGYDERGPVFDHRVVELLSEADFPALERLDPDLVQRAGECGLRSLIALGGFLGEQAPLEPQIYSYEGPFGVGYLVAGFGSRS